MRKNLYFLFIFFNFNTSHSQGVQNIPNNTSNFFQKFTSYFTSCCKKKQNRIEDNQTMIGEKEMEKELLVQNLTDQQKEFIITLLKNPEFVLKHNFCKTKLFDSMIDSLAHVINISGMLTKLLVGAVVFANFAQLISILFIILGNELSDIVGEKIGYTELQGSFYVIMENNQPVEIYNVDPGKMVNGLRIPDGGYEVTCSTSGSLVLDMKYSFGAIIGLIFASLFLLLDRNIVKKNMLIYLLNQTISIVLLVFGIFLLKNSNLNPMEAIENIFYYSPTTSIQTQTICLNENVDPPENIDVTQAMIQYIITHVLNNVQKIIVIPGLWVINAVANSVDFLYGICGLTCFIAAFTDTFIKRFYDHFLSIQMDNIEKCLNFFEENRNNTIRVVVEKGRI